MEGIVSYGAYVPLNRMGPQTAGWNGRMEKAVANYDEDSLTMGVAAAMDCLKGVDRNTVDAVYFASTTAPYQEKQSAAIIRLATNLPKHAVTSDFGGSLRAGTIALQTALDAIRAGSAKRILVVASDLRVPGAGSDFEQSFGDGAVALLIGNSHVVAAIENHYQLSDEIFDVWRAGDGAMHIAEDRFALEKGYLTILPQVVSELLKRAGLAADHFSKAVFYGPDARRHADMGRRLGFDPKGQVENSLFSSVGNTGVSFALLMLVAALEEAKVDDRILMANYGNGADAFILKLTGDIEKMSARRGFKNHIQHKKTLSDYQKYARWRGLINISPAARRPDIPAPSTSALWRDRDTVIGFSGSKCNACGYPQYPPQRICTRCHAKDEFEPYRFADKGASLFTFSGDFLADNPDPPLIVAIIDFEGGGRTKTMVTDGDINQLKIGELMEMTFRKLYTAEGIHHYFWKAMPAGD